MHDTSYVGKKSSQLINKAAGNKVAVDACMLLRNSSRWFKAGQSSTLPKYETFLSILWSRVNEPIKSRTSPHSPPDYYRNLIPSLHRTCCELLQGSAWVNGRSTRRCTIDANPATRR